MTQVAGSMSGVSSALVSILLLSSVGAWSSLAGLWRLVTPIASLAPVVLPPFAPTGACHCHCDVNVTSPSAAPERWQPPGGALLWVIAEVAVFTAAGVAFLCVRCCRFAPEPVPWAEARSVKRRLAVKTTDHNLAVDGSTL